MSGGNRYPRAYATSTLTHQIKFWARIRRTDILRALGAAFMAMWPFAFFVAVWARDGIQMNDKVATFVTKHPQIANFVVTVIGTVVRLAVGFLFSEAILRFSQEWITERHLNLFHVTLISGFRNQNFPWRVKDLKYLLASSKIFRTSLVLLCLGTFVLIPSGTTSLLSPVPFDKTAPLRATEIDFASRDSDCVTWFNNQTMAGDCSWSSYSDLTYVNCLAQYQVIDALQVGRDNMGLVITNSSKFFDFSQFGATNGPKFLEPLRGVLPIGRNGIQVFDTVEPSPLSDPRKLAGMLSYNYTLDNQGFNTNVSCEYTQQSPLTITPLSIGNGSTSLNVGMTYTGSCPGLSNVVLRKYTVVYSENSLAFWACKSLSNGSQPSSYYIYLHGLGAYGTQIGNITCTMSPIQPALYEVTYQSVPDIFSSTESILLDPTAYSAFIDQSLISLGQMIANAQNGQANQFAELVDSLGIMSFKLLPGQREPGYLLLYEAMIQGIMQYLATSARFLYSTGVDRPASCNRSVTGTLRYKVIGWSVTPIQVLFLMPMTIVNVASLAIMIFVILNTKPGSFESDPTGSKELAMATHYLDEGEPTGWKDCVEYHERCSEKESDLEPLQGESYLLINS